MLALPFVLALLAIVYEDFRFRAIHLVSIGGLLLGALLLTKVPPVIAGFNLAVIVVQLIMLWAFLCLRQRHFVRLFRDYLGAGDVVFWSCLALLFPTPQFVLFFIGSLLVSLGLTLLLRRSPRWNLGPTVPLAGLQAAQLLVLLAWHYAGFRSGLLI
jgi:hypothetical protein